MSHIYILHKLFLSELCQTSTNLNNFWYSQDPVSRPSIYRPYMAFHPYSHKFIRLTEQVSFPKEIINSIVNVYQPVTIKVTLKCLISSRIVAILMRYKLCNRSSWRCSACSGSKSTIPVGLYLFFSAIRINWCTDAAQDSRLISGWIRKGPESSEWRKSVRIWIVDPDFLHPSRCAHWQNPRANLTCTLLHRPIQIERHTNSQTRTHTQRHTQGHTDDQTRIYTHRGRDEQTGSDLLQIYFHVCQSTYKRTPRHAEERDSKANRGTDTHTDATKHTRTETGGRTKELSDESCRANKVRRADSLDLHSLEMNKRRRVRGFSLHPLQHKHPPLPPPKSTPQFVMHTAASVFTCIRIACCCCIHA